MELKFQEMIKQITDFMETEAKTSTVVRVGMGFGSGAGEGDAPKQGHGEGGGVGAGMGIEPIGFLVTRDDMISFISTKQNKGLASAFEKVPDLIEKFLDTKKKAEVVN